MTNRTELTAERIERAIAIQKELIRDMRSDEADKDNRETAEEVAEIVETVVIPALRAANADQADKLRQAGERIRELEIAT